jgi:hypothetical protein
MTAGIIPDLDGRRGGERLLFVRAATIAMASPRQ